MELPKTNQFYYQNQEKIFISQHNSMPKINEPHLTPPKNYETKLRSSSNVHVADMSVVVESANNITTPKTVRKMRRNGTICIDDICNMECLATEKPLIEPPIDLYKDTNLVKVPLRSETNKVKDYNITRTSSSLRDVVDKIPKFIFLPDDSGIAKWGIVVVM